MNYTTGTFFIFLAVIMLIYFLFPKKKYQWVVLLMADYFFYCFASWKFVGYLLFTTATTYGIALWLDKVNKTSKTELKEHKSDWDKEQKKAYKQHILTQKKWIAAIALVSNFGILAFLKYYNFLSGSLNTLFTGTVFEFPTFRLLLPLGISFYTFQSMGYVIDVYRGKYEATRNFGKIALYVSFFPQIIQGPIGVYDQLGEQLYQPHSFDFTRFKYGIELILWGYLKKLVIADRAVSLITAVTEDYTAFAGSTLLFTLVLYALQLYADFSGGIDISIGIAQILGITMSENFKRPYFAKSITEYWQRWHITLGAWMKNYIFYPIAMSKVSQNVSKKIKATKFGDSKYGSYFAMALPPSIASLITFTVVGIWHGANWKYVAFGVYNGVIIMLSTLLKPVFDTVLAKLKINVKSWWYQLFQMGRTFILVLISYITDLAPDLHGCFDMLKLMFTDIAIKTTWHQINTDRLGRIDYLLLAIGTLVLLFVSILQEINPDETIRERLDKKHFAIRWLLITAGLILVLTLGIWGPGYDPADFVYMQF